MELTQRILDYYDNYVSESAYLDDIAGSVAVNDLFAATVELLQSSDHKTLPATLLFVQDLISYYPSEARQAVSTAYPGSIVVQALEALLHSECHGTRKQAAYVLGKTGSESSVKAMTEAFHQWRDRDPIMLPRLMGELGWLGAENFDELLDAMVASQRFPTRWATVSLLQEFLDEPETALFDQKKQRWEILRHDPHPLIRQEAEYQYQLQLFRLEASRLSPAEIKQHKADRRKARKALDRQYEPGITFSAITSHFMNYCYELGRKDYTIDQLEAFIEQYVADQLGSKPVNP
jgi:hypothetical protein